MPPSRAYPYRHGSLFSLPSSLTPLFILHPTFTSHSCCCLSRFIWDPSSKIFAFSVTIVFYRILLCCSWAGLFYILCSWIIHISWGSSSSSISRHCSSQQSNIPSLFPHCTSSCSSTFFTLQYTITRHISYQRACILRHGC